MGKRSPDRDEILGYIREGWYFRIKTVKGRRYITRRRGQEERSLGPYDKDLWNLISQIVQQAAETATPQAQDRDILKTEAGKPPEVTPEPARIEKAQQREEDFSRLQDQLSLNRGVMMMTSCGHRDKKGFCTYWSWKKKPDFSDLMDKLLFKDLYRKTNVYIRGQETERWVVKAIHWYCWGCSAYHPIK